MPDDDIFSQSQQPATTAPMPPADSAAPKDGSFTFPPKPLDFDEALSQEGFGSQQQAPVSGQNAFSEPLPESSVVSPAHGDITTPLPGPSSLPSNTTLTDSAFPSVPSQIGAAPLQPMPAAPPMQPPVVPATPTPIPASAPMPAPSPAPAQMPMMDAFPTTEPLAAPSSSPNIPEQLQPAPAPMPAPAPVQPVNNESTNFFDHPTNTTAQPLTPITPPSIQQQTLLDVDTKDDMFEREKLSAKQKLVVIIIVVIGLGLVLGAGLWLYSYIHSASEDAIGTVDSDSDGLTDSQESFYKTDPKKADSDSDGYTDGEEVQHGYNPLGEGKLKTAPVDSKASNTAI